MDVKSLVRQFVSENFYVADPQSFGDSTSFLEQGIVDSTAILEVVAFLEERFHIQVDDTEFVPENLDSLERIAAFVARKRQAAAPPEPAAVGVTRVG
jgi:acyl carrier protein